MRNKRKNLGFTIIEIAVVLTISAILLTMASMSLSSSEKGNRDNERSADIEMLVQCLEDGYISTQEYVGTISDLVSKGDEFTREFKEAFIDNMYAEKDTFEEAMEKHHIMAFQLLFLFYLSTEKLKLF